VFVDSAEVHNSCRSKIVVKFSDKLHFVTIGTFISFCLLNYHVKDTNENKMG